MFALGLIYVVLTTEALPKRMSPGWRTYALATLHAAGVVVLGFIWLHAGGIANPLFVLSFALPVIGAGFISRWQPYLTATLAVMVIFAVVLSQVPELRWYVSGFGAAGAWVASLFGAEDSAMRTPVPGFYAPFSYFAVLLQVLAVLLFGCAVAADSLGTVFERLRTRLAAARAEAERGQELWKTLTEHLPLPAFLVDADTLCVICASDQAATEMLPAKTATPAGRPFFEVVHFSYPDVVQNLIEGAGGVAPGAMIRVTGELRATEVSVRHMPYPGRRLALVVIRDVTDATCVRIALDMADHAALVVDSRGRVKAFNKAALALFPGTRIGTDVSLGLPSPSAWGAFWWQSGITGRRKAHVEIRQRTYEVTRSAAVLPGEEESVHVVALRPVAKTQSADAPARASTLPGRIEVEPR
jgi:PAS domain-containing protein